MAQTLPFIDDSPRQGRGPDQGPRAPRGFNAAVKEVVDVIIKKANITAEGITKAVVPSVPQLISEIAEDLKTGSVDKFGETLKKLENIVSSLGLDLRKYNKSLADFMAQREEKIQQSEERIVKIREQGAKATIDQVTGQINILSRKEIVQKENELKQVILQQRKEEKEFEKNRKFVQENRFSTEEEVNNRKEILKEQSLKIEELKQTRENLRGELNIDEENEPAVGIGYRFRSVGEGAGGIGQGLRDFTPDFLLEIFDTFTQNLMLFVEPLMMLKDTALSLLKPFRFLLKPLKSLGGLFKPVILGLKRLAAALVAAIVPLFPYILIAAAVGIALYLLRDKIKEVAEAVKEKMDLFVEKFQMAIDFIKDIPKKIGNIAGDIKTAVSDMFIKIMNGMIDVLNFFLPGFMEVDKFKTKAEQEKEMQNKMTEYYQYPDEKFAGSGSNAAIENIQAAKKKENAIAMGGMIEGPQLVKPPSLINNSSNIMSSSSMSQVNSVGIKTISIDPYITDYSE